MTEREKLIKIVTNALSEYCSKPISEGTEPQDFITDYLLKNGVTIPLVKMGDTVYQTDNAGDIYESEVTQVVYGTNGIAFDERAIEKSVFLTREEAEKGLWIARYKV